MMENINEEDDEYKKENEESIDNSSNSSKNGKKSSGKQTNILFLTRSLKDSEKENKKNTNNLFRRKSIFNYQRRDKKKCTILFQSNISLHSEKINYPLDDLKPIPIIITSKKELVYLYLTRDEHDFLLKKLDINHYYAIREEEIKNPLKIFIPLYFEKIFKHKECLEKRLAKSLSETMKDIKPNFSIAIEMDEKFKNTDIVKEQTAKYLLVKKDILKHLDINKKEIINFDPFSRIKFGKKNKNNKEPLPKWAVSLKMQFEKDSSSSSEDEVENDKNDNNVNNKYIDMNDIKEKNDYDDDLFNIKEKYNKEDLDEKLEYPYQSYIEKLFYPKLNDFRKDIIEDCFKNKNTFGKIDFQKFICILEFFITLFSGIQVKYSIDELGFLNMDLYAREIIYMNMAEILHYQVQFQIRDKSHSQDEEEDKNKPNFIYLNTRQYHEVNIDEIEYFPPSKDFSQKLSNKFRRYSINDYYHLCSECESLFSRNKAERHLCNSSVFRFIDKTRLLIAVLSGIIDMNYLEKVIKENNDEDNEYEQSKLFKETMILRNEELLEELKDPFIFSSYFVPLQTKKNKKLDNYFRNIYGESIGYYYTWISHYLSWILFPSILSLLTEITLFFLEKNNINNNINTYIYIVYLILILSWGFYYARDWYNFQKFYNYIWTMDSYQTEIINLYKNNYSKSSYVSYLGISIPKVDKLQSLLVNFISIFLIFISSLFIIAINIGIFKLFKLKIFFKKYIIKNYIKFNLPYQIDIYILPIFFFIAREILSSYIYIFSETLANLEKPSDKEEYEEIITKKRLILEFVNYYFNLYYIAFYRKVSNTCESKDCFLELRRQLTLILISNIIYVIIKFIYRIIYVRKSVKNFELRITQKLKTGLIEKLKFYTREQFTEEDVQKLIIPIIFDFGYIIQFGTCCPISFIFLFILVILYRITNSISMVYLFYVKSINISKGLTIYNKTQFALVFIGIFSNIGIIFYTNNNSLKQFSIITKLLMFIIIQNGIIIIYFVFNFESLPFWFKYRENIKLRYLKRFGVVQATKEKKDN